MTRKEQIENAAKKYATHWVDTNITDFHGKYEQKLDFVLPEHNAFLAGAEWADANPKLPWVSVEEDLPCNHKELMQNQHYTKKVLVILAWDDNPSKRHIELCDMCSKVYPCNTNWRWRQPTYYHVTHWMPLPELPTKE